jgi:transposase InsO family protein
MNAAVRAVPGLGPVAVCDALGVSRASLHRLRNPPLPLPEPRRRPSPPRALPAEERVTVLGYFYLYVILDVFSRHMAGWMVADREGKELAR